MNNLVWRGAVIFCLPVPVGTAQAEEDFGLF